MCIRDSDKVIAKILFGADFYEAWKYAPFLMISVVFGALVQLLGGIFSAAKESKVFGNTILIGAAANTVMNVAFVYACGPLGAAIATSLSYMLIWVLRLYKVTRQMKLDISLIRDVLSYVLLYLQATLLVFYSYNWSGYLIRIRLTRRKHRKTPRRRRNTNNRIWNFNRHLPFCLLYTSLVKNYYNICELLSVPYTCLS